MQIGKGPHSNYAGHRPRACCIDVVDTRMRERAANECSLQHSGEPDVVDVTSPPPEQAVVLDALDWLTNQSLTCLGFCFHRSTRHQVESRFNHPLVSSAPADVPGQLMAHFVLVQRGTLLVKAFGRDIST